jgi:hypothetical protein
MRVRTVCRKCVAWLVLAMMLGQHFAEVTKASVRPWLASPSRSHQFENDFHILPRIISPCDRFSDRSLTQSRRVACKS